MIAAGVGFSNACEASDIIGAVRAAASEAGVGVGDIGLLCTMASKADAAALHAATLALKLPLTTFDTSTLAARNDDTLTRSERVAELTGLSSVAETSALAGAGTLSRLLGPRLIHGLATCAIAVSETYA